MICAKEGNMAMMETLMSQSEKAVDLNMQDAVS